MYNGHDNKNNQISLEKMNIQRSLQSSVSDTSKQQQLYLFRFHQIEEKKSWNI